MLTRCGDAIADAYDTHVKHCVCFRMFYSIADLTMMKTTYCTEFIFKSTCHTSSTTDGKVVTFRISQFRGEIPNTNVEIDIDLP